MKILFAADVPPDPDSGAAGTEWQTIRALREAGHEVHEIWAADLGRRIRHGNLHYLLELPYRFRSVIGERASLIDFDVLHVNQGHSYLAAIDHRRRRRRGVFVCRSHGLDDHMERTLAPWRRRLGLPQPSGPKALVGQWLQRALRRHDRLAYRHADGVLVSAQHDADYLTGEMRVDPSRVGCVPQAPAAAFVAGSAEPMRNERMRRILHVGGFAYWKGVHAVAAAAQRLLEHDPDTRMTWVCRPEEHRKVRDLFAAAQRDRLQLLGWMSQQQLCEVYDRHGVFLCPSLFDGFGKVFLEAMARGLCVVGTPTGGMPDVIRRDRDGVIVGFDAADEIVAAVLGLWSEPQRMLQMSAAAAERAREYSWQRVASETADFYRHLLSLKAASGGAR